MPDQPMLFDPAPESPSTDNLGQPRDRLTTTPMQIDTDLHLPLSGRSGNHDAAVEHALDVLQAAGIGLDKIVDLVTNAVPAPPLNTADTKEVLEWLDVATWRILNYETSWRVRRGVLDLLDAQFHLDYHARRHAERIQWLAEDHAAKVAGTYWRDRDARRRATRPIHVDVDPDAWAALKLDAVRRGTTLGEAVGALVTAEVGRGGQTFGQTRGETCGAWSDLRGQPGRGRRAKVFARVAVDDDSWAEMRAFALGHRVTVARAVGVLVEQAVAQVRSGSNYP